MIWFILALACRDKDKLPIDSSVTDDSAAPDACPVLHVDSELSFTDVPYSTQTGEITVTNLCVGSASLTTNGAISGSSAFDAELSIPVLEPGSTHTLEVTFNPSDFDPQTAEIAWTSDGGDGLTALSGNAVADADGDSFDSEEAGGEDCDDTDASVYPGAEDDWYDGIDSNCDGEDDYDQDGDGYTHPDGGGLDCDDEDADINPGAEDTPYDGEDTDCDRLSDYDADGDGHDHPDYGGDDCDDTDASISPSAEETWYDGVDQNCDELSDYDQDGDGADSDDHGGDDCDDTDASVYYDSGETAQDLADDDCDGLVDEDYIIFGAIILSELMIDSSTVDDTDGEWFEVYNTTSNDIDMVGWEIKANDGDEFEVDSSLVVAAGDYAVFGVNSDATQNGGLSLDYEYDFADFSFDQGTDSIFLYLGENWLNRARVTSDWTVPEGASLNLDADYLEAAYTNEPDYWCSSEDVFGDGDAGTPGDANIECTGNDYDGDGYSRDDGDCDETDSSISPDGEEVWDEVDNDCDDYVDNMSVSDAATAHLTGDYGDYIAWPEGISVGDWDGDGQDDMALGGLYTGNSDYQGGLYLVDGAPYAGYAGQVSDNDYAYIDGGTYYNYFGHMDPVSGDQDGDGSDDLYVGANDYYYGDGSGNYAAALFYGGSMGGTYDIADADVLWSGSQSYGYTEVLSSVDFDGDGQDDVVHGDYGNYNTYEGFVYLFLGASIASGSEYDLLTDADTYWYGDDGKDYMGSGLSGGDVDGDGYDDLFMSAGYGDQGTTNSGSLYLIYGAATVSAAGTADSAASLTLYGEGISSYFSHVTDPVIGDFDDDGTVDVAAASYTDQTAYVFLDVSALSGKIRADSADITISASAPDYFGINLTAGDYDGDGYSDLAIAAPDYTSTYYSYYYADDAGTVFLFSGADLGTTGSYTDTDANASFDGTATGDLLGIAMSSYDWSGDGNDDLILAAPAYDHYYGRFWIVEAP